MKMHTFKWKILFTISILILGVHTFAQKALLGENSYIVTFDALFKSNLIELNSYTNDLYLLKSNKTFKIDSLFCSLSKKNYMSLSDILDTLNKQFEVYVIANNNIPYYKKENVQRVFQYLVNYNHYKTGYLYQLNSDFKKNNVALVGYIIQLFSRRITVLYDVVGLNKPSNKYKEIVIYRLE